MFSPISTPSPHGSIAPRSTAEVEKLGGKRLQEDRVAQNLHQYARYGVESWDLTFSQSPFAAEVLALYFKVGWGHLLIRNVLNVGEPQL